MTPIEAEIEKTRFVARQVHEAGQTALMLLARAESWLEDRNAANASRCSYEARQRLLKVYARIGTLLHDGPQPKAVPA